MAKIRIPYVIFKPKTKGGYTAYWQPNTALRKQGWKAEKLGSGNLNDPQFITRITEAANTINRQIAEWRNGQGKRLGNKDSIAYLIDRFKEDRMYLKLKPSTQSDYRRFLSLLSDKWGHFPAKGVTRKAAKAYHEYLRDKAEEEGKSLRWVKYAMEVTRRFFFFCIDEGEIADNPFSKMGVESAPPREVIWPFPMIDYFIRQCDKHGYSSIGTAVLIASDAGQRRGDIITMPRHKYDGTSLLVRQSKGGAVVKVQCTEELKKRLDGAKKHPLLIVREDNHAPYNESHFTKLFRKLHDEFDLVSHAKTLPDEDILDGFIPAKYTFHDLRRTSVVRLAMAGVSIPMIAAVTGHSIDQTTKILETYLPRNTAMAKAAITQLEEFKKSRQSENKK